MWHFPPVRPALCLLAWMIPLTVIADSGSQTATRAVVEQRVLELSAGDIPAANGLAVSGLSVVRWHDGGWEPVPFQIDEMSEGDLVWFPEPGLARNGEPEVFDAADQLLMMFRDGGQRKPADAELPQGRLLSELKAENEAGEPVWFYLVHGAAARSERRYVDHNLSSGVTRTPHYRLEVDPENELNWLALDYEDYTGEGSIIDTLKMRMEAGVLTRFARVTLDNDNLEPRLAGFREGPIRSVMHLETRVVIAGIPVIKMHVQAYRYAGHYEAHTLADVPLIYRATLKQPSMSVSVDGHNQTGARVRTARSGDLEARVDGRMDDQERKLVSRGLSTDENWILFETDQRFMLLTFLEVGPDLKNIPLGLVYQDDQDLTVEPEQYPGQLPNVGYALEGWPPKSRMRFAVKLLFDSSLRGLSPPQYVALRAGDSGRITSRPLVAE
jgi:hypothetical protein